MITANEAYALTKMSIAKKAREAYTDALNVAKHTDDRTSVAICEKVYVDVIDIVNAAVELLVALAENTKDEKAKKHAYSVLEKMEKTFIDYKTADRVKKLFDAGNKEFTNFAITEAYADFANANLKMLADLAAQRKIAVLNNSKTPFIDALENDNKISSEDARNARVIYNCVCEESDDRIKYALLEYICEKRPNSELLIFAFRTLYSIYRFTNDEHTKKNIDKLYKRFGYCVTSDLKAYATNEKVQKLIDSYIDTLSRIVFVDGVK